VKKILPALLASAVAFTAAVVFWPTAAHSEAAPTSTPFSVRSSCTTNAQGYCTVNHNLGVVPTVVQAQAINYSALTTTRNWTANSVEVRLAKRINTSNGVDPWPNITVQVTLVGAYTPATATPTPTKTTPSATQPTRTTPPATTAPVTTPPTVPPTTTTPPVVIGAYPTTASTGVPEGAPLTAFNGDMVITTDNTVVDAKKISGDVDIRAAGVVIKNSEILGKVVNDNIATHNAFTIQDSTVGSATACSTWQNGAIGTENYTALRVHLRGFVDGFRVAGGNVRIQDSYVKLCGNNPDYHSDGIQAYGASGGKNIVIKHNTIDQRSVLSEAQTSPIFIPNDGANQGNQNLEVTIEDNVLAGGGYSLRVFGDLPFTAPSVSGNKIVNGSWGYGPVDVTCSKISKWEDNAVVTYDWDAGKILSEVRSLDSEC
jgi:hypothetical protein